MSNLRRYFLAPLHISAVVMSTWMCTRMRDNRFFLCASGTVTVNRKPGFSALCWCDQNAVPTELTLKADRVATALFVVETWCVPDSTFAFFNCRRCGKLATVYQPYNSSVAVLIGRVATSIYVLAIQVVIFGEVCVPKRGSGQVGEVCDDNVSLCVRCRGDLGAIRMSDGAAAMVGAVSAEQNLRRLSMGLS